MSVNTKFPIPAEVRAEFKKFAEQATGRHVVEENIKKISVRHFSNRIRRQITSEISVGGELDTNLSNIPHEHVLAIFAAENSDDYLVVTPDKGNTVYLFSHDEVIDVEKES